MKKMLELNKIYNEDCLIGMYKIPDGSIDMILCDLPFGKLDNSWDASCGIFLFYDRNSSLQFLKNKNKNRIAHTGKPYVNGHCFVSLTLCVKVKSEYYKIWTGEKSKCQE